MAAAPRPWLADRTQRWRWRYPSLWAGPSFDPDDRLQTYSYAFQRLSKAERAVFALCRFQDMGYPEIAHTLGIGTAAVERHLAHALYKLSRIVDLVDHARGRSRDASMAPDRQLTDM